MSGDNSRDSFDALRDFAGVFLQQGRAVLDADWNELVEIFERRIRAGTIDTIGRAVVPRETMEGFRIRVNAGEITIGPGSFYLDGMRLQNHGFANFDGRFPDRPAPVQDRGVEVEDGGLGVLDELTAPPDAPHLPYEAQPYWPTPAALPTSGTHLAYLVAWQREVTPVKDPSLLDSALGGLDTTTRWQTVWQVRLLENVGTGTTCATPDEDVPGWIEQRAPSTARLTTSTIDIDTPEDPCLVPPTDGYTGIENQLYRVELHSLEAGAAPTHFKYSRENASVTAAIEAIASDAASITVSRIGRDDILRFSPNDWVEVTDNIREFNHRSGQILRVATVNVETREITFEAGAAVSGDLIPSGDEGDTFADRRPRLIRWDQNDVIREADNVTEWVNLGPGSNGLIPIPPAGTVLHLEKGITIEFSTAEGPGTFRDMDYWRFSARTATTTIDELSAAPPEGIQRHYARLAVVNMPSSELDCRTHWPPEFPGGGETESCGCTVCVSAEGHNSGALTIQAAIDQVETAGGTVCLDAGAYALDAPVTISDRASLRIRGQGIGTLLFYQGPGGAIQIDSSTDVVLEDFAVLATPGEDGNGNVPIAHGVTSVNSPFSAFRRMAIIVAASGAGQRFDFGIALDGFNFGTIVEECFVVGAHALGARSTYGLDEDGDLTFAAFGDLRVCDNILFGARAAMLFDRACLSLSQARFERNLALGLADAVRINFGELPSGSIRFEGSTIIAAGDGVALGSSDLRIQDCRIGGGNGEQPGDGIVILENLVPDRPGDVQIIGNSVLNFAGSGVRISGVQSTALIKRNVVRNCGFAGIFVEPSAEIGHVAIDNNVVEEIADPTGSPDGAGVMLFSAASAQIVGNSIRGVGLGGDDGRRFAGIAAQAVGSLEIGGNRIAEIGPDRAETVATGIFVRRPYGTVSLSGNRIDGTVARTDDFTGWAAIDIGAPERDGDFELGEAVLANAASLPGMSDTDAVFVELAEETFALSATSFAVTPSKGRLSQIVLSGNQTSNTATVRRPVVRAVDPAARAVGCHANQCLQSGDTQAREVVLIGGATVTAGNNSVLHSRSGAISISILARSSGVTALGNVTSRGVFLNGGPLPAPFDALNVID